MVGRIVYRQDPDRFLTALFAPAARREAVFTLYAFNHELARALDVASQPVLALIRLQWWREVVEGAERRHEVATPLRQCLARGALAAEALEALIVAREAEVNGGFATVAAWRDWLLSGAGGVAVAAALALGAPEPERFRPCGAAYGLAGTLRDARRRARAGNCVLPGDALAAHGLSQNDLFAEPDGARLDPVLRDLAGVADPWLGAKRRPMPKSAIAAALPMVLARRDLRRIGQPPSPRGLGDRLAVMLAGLRAAV